MKELDHRIQPLSMATQRHKGGHQTQTLFIMGVEPLDGPLALPDVHAGQAGCVQHIAKPPRPQWR